MGGLRLPCPTLAAATTQARKNPKLLSSWLGQPVIITEFKTAQAVGRLVQGLDLALDTPVDLMIQAVKVLT